MATGVLKELSLIAVEEESTEGTYVAPQAATSYIQAVNDGTALQTAREILERPVMGSYPGRPTPLMGVKQGTGNIVTEFRASGTEGAAPDFHSLLEGALGSSRTNTSQTSSTSHTSTVINFADASSFNVGDIVMVEESGAFELRPIVSTTGTSITLAFALTNGAPSDSVEVSAYSTYLTAATGHPSLSVSNYIGNTKRKALYGARVSSMSLENYAAGQLATLNFALQGINHSLVDGAAPHTPSYDSGIPPVILSACVYRDGVVMETNDFGLTLTNTWVEKRSTCNANGITGQVLSAREVTGTINPLMDDTTTDRYDDWVGGTEFSLFITAYTPGASGAISLGSAVAIWLPQCVITELQDGDVSGISSDALTYRATRGSTGGSEEMYLGMV